MPFSAGLTVSPCRPVVLSSCGRVLMISEYVRCLNSQVNPVFPRLPVTAEVTETILIPVALVNGLADTMRMLVARLVQFPLRQTLLQIRQYAIVVACLLLVHSVVLPLGVKRDSRLAQLR